MPGSPEKHGTSVGGSVRALLCSRRRSSINSGKDLPLQSSATGGLVPFPWLAYFIVIWLAELVSTCSWEPREILSSAFSELIPVSWWSTVLSWRVRLLLLLKFPLPLAVEYFIIACPAPLRYLRIPSVQECFKRDILWLMRWNWQPGDGFRHDSKTRVKLFHLRALGF